MPVSADLVSEFRVFWDASRTAAFQTMCDDEGLNEKGVLEVDDQYRFNGHRPSTDQSVACLTSKPKILDRQKIVNDVIEKILGFVETFEDDLGDV